MRGTCTESLYLILGQAVNRKNTKTVDKHGEVVEKPLYKYVSEELMHFAAWCDGTADQSSRNSGK